MRLSSVLLSLACVLGVATAVLSFLNPNAILVECPGNDNNLLVLDYINLIPNPPQKGQVLNIDAKGLLRGDVVEGAKIFLNVKVGVITMSTMELDFCEESAKNGKPCPLLAGEQTFHYSVKLPKEIPPGKYDITFRVMNPEEEHVACVMATFVFNLF